MRLILIITFTFFLVHSSYSQVYETQFIVDTAEKILKDAVGKHVFSYYQYDKDSYYKCRTKSGKSKWIKISKKEYTKGTFESVNVKFVLHHPGFAYEYVNKTTNIQLDSSLRLIQEPNIIFIPEFIRKNESSNWLTDKEIDKIIEELNLKETKYELVKRLEYNHLTRKYTWTIFNTLLQTKFYSEIEYVEIDPISGEVIIFEEQTQL